MKIGSISRNGVISLVVETNRGTLDMAEGGKRYKMNIPTTMKALIEAGAEGKSAVVDLVEAVQGEGNSDLYLLDGTYSWAPILNNPEKIICVGLNYRKHAIETCNPIPERPILFSKFNNALAGHGSEVMIPPDALEPDYEAELAIVIGNECHTISEDNALEFVFGYAVANDISARDLQMVTSQWLLGKTCDNFAPIGPYIVTADAVPDPNDLRITCTRNGIVVQDSNTNDMIFNCKQIISYCSRYFTLKPGDIILTGTPEGVIMGLPKKHQVWLQPGDHVVTSIEGIGELEFSVGADKGD